VRETEGRGRGGWRPNDQERRLLDLVAEGRSDAEIGVRLGQLPDFIKSQVEGIAGAAGARDRQALVRWWQRQQEQSQRLSSRAFVLLGRTRRFWPGIALAAVVALGVAVIALPSEGDGGGVESRWQNRLEQSLTATAEAFVEAGPPSTCEPPQRQDLRLVTPSELVAQGLEPAGHLIRTTHCPMYVANRVDRAVAWVAGAGELAVARTPGWRVENARSGFVVLAYDDEGTERYVQATGTPQDILGRNFVASAFTRNSAVKIGSLGNLGGHVVFSVIRGRGQTEQARIALASNGEVFIDSRPVAREVVHNGITGETLDMSRLAQIGRLGVAEGRNVPVTECSVERSVCAVTYIAGSTGLSSPVAGRLRCLEPELRASSNVPEYVVDAERYSLRLRSVGFAVAPDCNAREVAVGDNLPVPGSVIVFALRPDGSLQSVVAAGDGTLYVGEVQLRLGCPCTNQTLVFPQ